MMRVPQVAIRSAAGLLAVAVVVTAWRVANPPPAFRAAARIQVAEDPVTDVAGEVTALMRQVSGTPVAVTRVNGGHLIEVSLQGADADLVGRTVNDVVDDFLRTREADRARRAQALLGEIAADVKRQTEVVQRVERARADARAQMARIERDREAVTARLRDVEFSLARARERVAELEPLVTYLKSGRPPEALSVIQNFPFIQQLQGRLAVLEGERASLLTRYGQEHPEIERNADERASVAAKLRGEIANITGMLARDYEAVRIELAWLENDRKEVLQLSKQPLPSDGEYMSLSRRLSAERDALSALELREQDISEIVAHPGSGVARVDRAAPVRPMVPSPAQWPWALAALAALAAALAAPSILRTIGRSGARRVPE